MNSKELMPEIDELFVGHPDYLEVSSVLSKLTKNSILMAQNKERTLALEMAGQAFLTSMIQSNALFVQLCTVLNATPEVEPETEESSSNDSGSEQETE